MLFLNGFAIPNIDLICARLLHAKANRRPLLVADPPTTSEKEKTSPKEEVSYYVRMVGSPGSLMSFRTHFLFHVVDIV